MKRSVHMYLIAILALVIVSVALASMGGFGDVSILGQYFFWPESLLVLFILCLFMLLATQSLKDFNNAFLFTLKKNSEATLYQMKRSQEAVKMVMSTLLYGSLFFFAFGIQITLYRMSTPESLGPILARLMAGVVYSMLINMILIIISSVLKCKIMDYVESGEDETIPESIGTAEGETVKK